MARKTTKQSVGNSNKKGKGYKGWKESADSYIKEVKSCQEAYKSESQTSRVNQVSDLDHLPTCSTLASIIQEGNNLSLGEDHGTLSQLLALQTKVDTLKDTLSQSPSILDAYTAIFELSINTDGASSLVETLSAPQPTPTTQAYDLTAEALQVFVKTHNLTPINAEKMLEESPLAQNSEFLKELYDLYSKVFIENLSQDFLKKTEQSIVTLSDLKISFDQTARLQAYVSTTKILKGIMATMDSEKVLGADESLITEISESVFATAETILSEAQFKTLQANFSELQSLQCIANIQNYEYIQFLDQRFSIFLWRQEAKSLLKSKKTLKNETIIALLKQAPAEIKSTKAREYKMLIEKVQGVTIDINEPEVESMIKKFYESENFLDQYEEIQTFVDTTKIGLISDALFKKLDLLSETSRVLKSKDYDSLELLVTKMLEDQFFWKSAIFEKIESIYRTTESWKQTKDAIDQFKSHTENQTFSPNLTLSSLKGFGKVSVSFTEDMISSFSNLSPNYQTSYTPYFEYLQESREEEFVIRQKFVKLIQDSKTKLQSIEQNLSLKPQPKAKFLLSIKTQTLGAYHGLLVDYEKNMIDSSTTVHMIRELDCVLKANCLVFDIEFVGLGRGYGEWEALGVGLGEFCKGSELELYFRGKCDAIELCKKKLGNKEHTKMMSLGEAKEFVLATKKSCEGVEFDLEKESFENVLKKVEDTMALVQGRDMMDIKAFMGHFEFLKTAPINVKEFLSDMDRTGKTAKVFVKKVCGLTPEDFIKQVASLVDEQKTLNLTTKEFDRMFRDYQRDSETANLIKNSFENYKDIDMEKIRELRAKFSSARYFKESQTELKLIDFHIRVLIATYKEQVSTGIEAIKLEDGTLDSEMINELQPKIEEMTPVRANEKNTEDLLKKPIIDYGTLKQLYIGIKLQDKNKDQDKKQIIKEENGVFIIRLYKKCKEYLKKNIFIKSLVDLQSTNYLKNYKNFVDLTGPIFDFMNRLIERSAARPQKTRKVIAPSGKKVSFKRTFNYDVSNSKAKEEIVKPSFENKITSQHRGYYISLFKLQLDRSQHFDWKIYETTCVAQDLEKCLIRLYTKPLEYEHYGDKIAKTLSKIRKFKYICLRLKSKDFDLGCINELKVLENHEFKRWDKLFKEKLERKSARKEKKRILKISKDPRYRRGVANANIDKKLKVEEKKMKREASVGQKMIVDLKRSALNNSGKKLKPKKMLPNFQATKTVYNKDIVIRPTTLVKSHYKMFKLFSGNFSYTSSKSSAPKELKKIELYAMNRKSRAEAVTMLPAAGMNLNTKINLSYFQKYMELITSDSKKRSYVALPGWVSSNNSTISMKSMLEETRTVASSQYSSRCKIFFFPVSALPIKLLRHFDFFVESIHTDLLYMIVLKRSEKGYETRAIPTECKSYHNTILKIFGKKTFEKKRKTYNPKKRLDLESKYIRAEAGKLVEGSENVTVLDKENNMFNDLVRSALKNAKGVGAKDGDGTKMGQMIQGFKDNYLMNDDVENLLGNNGNNHTGSRYNFNNFGLTQNQGFKSLIQEGQALFRGAVEHKNNSLTGPLQDRTFGMVNAGKQPQKDQNLLDYIKRPTMQQIKSYRTSMRASGLVSRQDRQPVFNAGPKNFNNNNQGGNKFGGNKPFFQNPMGQGQQSMLAKRAPGGNGNFHNRGVPMDQGNVSFIQRALKTIRNSRNGNTGHKLKPTYKRMTPYGSKFNNNGNQAGYFPRELRAHQGYQGNQGKQWNLKNKGGQGLVQARANYVCN